MSDEHDFELPEDVASLLDKAREIETPSREASARIWSRLEQSLGLPPLENGDDPPGSEAPSPEANPKPCAPESTPSSPSAPSSPPTNTAAQITSSVAPQAGASLMVSKGIAIAWTAATFAIGAAVGAGGHAIITRPEPAPAPKEIAVVRDMGVGDMAPSEDLSAEVLPDLGGSDFSNAPDLADFGDVAADAGTPPRKEEVLKKPAVTAKQRRALLRAEREVLARAERALASGDTKEALAALAEHERRFGTAREAQLAEERDVLFIRVLIAKGEMEDARRRFKRFREAHPRSIFIDALAPVLEK